MKTRVALRGGKYLLIHPRGRIARWTFRFAVRRLSKRLAARTRVETIPATRGSRLTTVAGILLVAGAIVLVVRRRGGAVPVVTPPAPPVATAPPETRDAPSAVPVTSQESEAAAATALPGEAPSPVEAAPPLTAPAGALGAADDDLLVARVEARLLATAPSGGVQVEAVSGVITLRGLVEDEDAETRVVKDAEQVEGVKAVQSELQTAGAEPGTSPS